MEDIAGRLTSPAIDTNLVLGLMSGVSFLEEILCADVVPWLRELCVVTAID